MLESGIWRMLTMNKMRIGIGAAVGFASIACSARAGTNPQRLVRDGATLSTDVIVVRGRAYLPLADAARAMGRRAVMTGDVYTLVRVSPGHSESARKAATQAVSPARSTPKNAMNMDIAGGGWVLRLLSADVTSSYVRQFGADMDPIAVQRKGDQLVVAHFRLTNASNATKDVYFDRFYAANTAVIDDASRGYPPLSYDSRNSEYASSRMLPGTMHEFALVFSVPADTRLSELVYSVASAGPDGADKPIDFRVALTP